MSKFYNSSVARIYNLATPAYWTPEEHDQFTKRFRDDIRMKLLSMRAGRCSGAFPALKDVAVLESLQLIEADDYEIVGEDDGYASDASTGTARYYIREDGTVTDTDPDLLESSDEEEVVRESKRRRLN